MTAPPDAFVPLSLAATTSVKHEEFRVLVATHPENARSLREANPAKDGSAAERSQQNRCEPRVTLQREGDCITAIQVHCSCGQIIDLKCAYSKGPASAAQA